MLPSSHPLHTTEMNVFFRKKKKSHSSITCIGNLKKKNNKKNRVSEAFNIKCSNPLLKRA